MSEENHSASRRRSRVSERAQEAYPAEPFAQIPEAADYAAYYSREGAERAQEEQPAFAPPPKLDHYGYEAQLDQPQADEASYSAENVYHPREATWVEERQSALAESELGYQVQAEDAPKPKRKKHVLRNILIALSLLALLSGGVWLFREPITEWLKQEALLPSATETAFEPVVTPEPVKAFDAAASIELADSARTAISRISGSVQMESYAVTDTHVVTRSQRADGSYDFYLFSSPEGRLLCYFEGLGPLDMLPQEGGSFYVRQSPYLIAPSGSALIRTEGLVSGEAILHPLYRGWSVIEKAEDGSANYVSRSGQLISTLWFSRTFPFTGEYTLAYVDTGSAAAGEERYLLYLLCEDGTSSRWLTAGDMEDVIGCAGGMAYLKDGSLYRLPDTSAPLLTSPEVHAYLDCDAMVVRDAESGKYGLLVHGEQHYDCVYDSIQPVESEMEWAQKTLTGEGGALTVHAVSGADYPQPLSYSFVLERGEQREYVALSTQSSYPIRLDGEF